VTHQIAHVFSLGVEINLEPIEGHEGDFAEQQILRAHEKVACQCFQVDCDCTIKSNLVTHMSTHTGQKPFQCSKRYYRCNRKNYLDRHILTHTDEHLSQCPKCDYKCADKLSLAMKAFSVFHMQI